MAFQRMHSEFPAISVAFRSSFLRGARPKRAQHTEAVLTGLGADRGRAVAVRRMHSAFPALSVAVRSPFPSPAGPREHSAHRCDPDRAGRRKAP
jgi:hypothetical protein